MSIKQRNKVKPGYLNLLHAMQVKQIHDSFIFSSLQTNVYNYKLGRDVLLNSDQAILIFMTNEKYQYLCLIFQSCKSNAQLLQFKPEMLHLPNAHSYLCTCSIQCSCS